MVDPWGAILTECDQNDVSVPQCKIAKISLKPLNDIRNRLPCFDHRRNDVYALAPLRMLTPEKSLHATCYDFKPIPVKVEETPHFIFEKYPVPKSTAFLETPLSIAFTNITCVVPGRKYNKVFIGIRFICLIKFRIIFQIF